MVQSMVLCCHLYLVTVKSLTAYNSVKIKLYINTKYKIASIVDYTERVV